jgi:hypothetical protein
VPHPTPPLMAAELLLNAVDRMPPVGRSQQFTIHIHMNYVRSC